MSSNSISRVVTLVLAGVLLIVGAYIIYTIVNPQIAPTYSIVVIQDPLVIERMRQLEETCKLLANQSVDVKNLVKNGYRLTSVSSQLKAAIELKPLEGAGGKKYVVMVSSPELWQCIAILSDGRRNVTVTVTPFANKD